MRPLAPALLLSVLLLSPGRPLRGDPAPIRVGVLFWHESPNDRAAFEGVREGFALARRDVTFDVFEAREDDRAARDALRRWNGDGTNLVYAMGTAAALRAREEARHAPVVFTAVTDPVGSGVVASANGSGGLICGTASGVAPQDALSVFRRAVPGLVTLGVVLNPANPVSRAEVEEWRRAGAAATPPVAFHVVERDGAALAAPGGVRSAVAAALARSDALWVPIDIDVYSRADQIAAAAAEARRPVLATAPAAARRGAAAVCVTVDFHALGRSSVVTAVRVLDGADPGTLPLTRPRSFRTLVNLSAARRAGYEIPLQVLAAADDFISDDGGR